MFVAYYRVSTQRQGDSGLGLEAQEHAVREYAKRAKRRIVAAFTEVESGRCRNRPRLAEAIATAKEKGATLIVAKLDRLARDVRLILELADSGVSLFFLDFPDLATHTSIGRMILVTMANLAEFEARRISERIREALARRRDRGLKHTGFSAGSRSQIRAAKAGGKAHRVAAAQYRERVLPIVAPIKAKLLTLTRAVDRLNARGIFTFSGKKWTIANLERFLKGR